MIASTRTSIANTILQDKEKKIFGGMVHVFGQAPSCLLLVHLSKFYAKEDQKHHLRCLQTFSLRKQLNQVLKKS